MIKHMSGDLILPVLAEGLPAVTQSVGATLAEAGAVCLEGEGHRNGVQMELAGDYSGSYRVYWSGVVPQMLRCWNDDEFTTEQGACGVAILLCRDLTGYTVVERSKKGTGFDYWLGDEETLPFQNKARLEVSGIRKGNEQVVKSRVRQKAKQVDKSNRQLPAYVVIVEFSRPTAQVIAK